jgi:ribosomal protein S8
MNKNNYGRRKSVKIYNPVHILSQLKMFIKAGHSAATVPALGVSRQVFMFLRNERLVSAYYKNSTTTLTCLFSTNTRSVLISDIKFYSKPGFRRFINLNQVQSLVYKDKQAVFRLQTPSGSFVSAVSAVEQGIGGELIAKISLVK